MSSSLDKSLPTTNPQLPPSADDETVVTPISPMPASTFGPPAAAGEVGTLGPYRLVKEVGKGGTGAVYAALDTRLDRRLVLKLMLPALAANPDARARFLREARAAAKISHDNVVTVYEADERDGVPYIATQFLRGLPLDQFLKQEGKLSAPQVMRIAREAAAGSAPPTAAASSTGTSSPPICGWRRHTGG
jgi:eukaryotic-like serine/threonine-protein kinase